MRFHILSLFPQVFQGVFDQSVLGRACRRGLISVDLIDIRAYTHDAHATADDYQFGGGHGMVLKPEPIFEAADAVLKLYEPHDRPTIPIVLLSPQGEVFNQTIAQELAQSSALMLVCGHYSGIDDRVRERLATREISVGDYVLTGGEVPAMALVDAVARLIPGVVGSAENVAEDSISSGLLQHPLFTRPPEFRGMLVPEVLRSGHHAEVERWRRRESLRRTLDRRPDLLQTAHLTPEDLAYLASLEYSMPEQSP
jgi:tRNA (guanine37-N1)-methyltransferase